MKAIFLLAGLAIFTAATAQQARPYPIPNQAHYERYAARYLPDYDWEWLAAQCFQESRYNPRARSPAGAMGECQFMPGTWREAQAALRVRDPFHAQSSIIAAAWYMRRMQRIWRAPRTDFQRLQLCQASYNAGAGNIIRAQTLCGGSPTWPEIKLCLPDVTGFHHRETFHYVDAIERWYKEIILRTRPNGCTNS